MPTKLEAMTKTPAKGKALLFIHIQPRGARAILVGQKGAVLAHNNQILPPHPFEHATHSRDLNPLETLYAVRSAINKVLLSAKLNPSTLEAIGLVTNSQAMVAWDKDNGLPLSPAVEVAGDRTLEF